MKLFEKFSLGSKEQVYDAIMKVYAMKGSCVVSFLYFANVMKGRLLEKQDHQWQRDYLQSLFESDFLLMDGIALQLFYRWGPTGRKTNITPPNLNGTDFNPYLIKRVIQDYKSVHIGLFTLYDESIGKDESHINHVKVAFEKLFAHPIDFSFQTHYKSRNTDFFDFDGYRQSIKEKNADISILLLSTGTPTQELWTLKNKEFIKDEHLLVINAGGTIDYISGFEKRAPSWVVKARILETPWRIMQNPKKNLSKFLVMFGVCRYWYGAILSGLSKKK